MTPRVSVVVSHYDRRAWLVEALASIAAQTLPPFEILVVADAGPSPADLLAPGTRLIEHAERRGVAAVRNTGVLMSRGTHVAYLDDDDLWAPGHLAALAEADAELAYGDAEVVRLGRGDGPPSSWPVLGRRTLAVPFDRADLARDDFVVPGGMLHTRALYDRVGPFDESLFVSDDWDWLLRAARLVEFVRVPSVVVTVRIHGDNLSGAVDPRRRAALDELERRHGTPRLEPKTFWEVAETYASR